MQSTMVENGKKQIFHPDIVFNARLIRKHSVTYYSVKMQYQTNIFHYVAILNSHQDLNLWPKGYEFHNLASVSPLPRKKRSLKLCPIGCDYYNLRTLNNIQNNTNTINLYRIAKLYNKQNIVESKCSGMLSNSAKVFSPLPIFFHFMINKCFTIHILFTL